MTHSLYRCFDGTGQILYVGITCAGGKRLDDHRRHAPWWGDVDYVKVEHYERRTEAEAAETAAIRADRPAHNIAKVRPSARPVPMTKVPQRGVRPHVDRLLDGNLDAWLAEQRTAGHSFAEIAFRLRTQHEVVVTGETVRAWCAEPSDMNGDAA